MILKSFKECKRQYLEIFFLILTGICHVLVELLFVKSNSPRENLYGADFIYNILVVILWIIYITNRVIHHPSLLKEWGFRMDNLRESSRYCILFLIPASIFLLIIGMGILGNSASLKSLFIILFIYPLWGLTQQSALQILVNRNLKDIELKFIFRLLIVGSLFGLSHFPNWILMSLVFPLGLITTWIYEKSPNLWTLGIMHGTLGTIAYFFILGQDPWQEMMVNF